VESIFAILNADPILTFLVSAVLSTRTRLPVKVLVHDPPTRMCSELNSFLAGLLRRLVETHLAHVVQKCQGLAVCSEGMQCYYQRVFGRDSEVMIHGLPDNLFRSRNSSFAQPGKLLIGFAGSAYPVELWNFLVEELNAVDWCIGGRRVEIHFVGHLPHWLSDLDQITMYGWQTQVDTLDILSRCDVCYLPFWFDPVHAESARQCFPTKLPTYVAAGRPILYHGPKNSTPSDFFSRYCSALMCHDLVQGRLVGLLQNLVATPGLLEKLASESHRAAQEYLREDLFVAAFKRLMLC